MSGQLRLAQHLPVDGSDGGKRSVTKADVHALRERVVSDVVGVVTKSNRLRHPVIVADELDTVTLTVGDGDQLRIRYRRDSLRLAKSRHAPEMRSALQVNDFE